MLYTALIVGKKTTIINMHYKAMAKAASIDFDFTDGSFMALEMLNDKNYDLVIFAINTRETNDFKLVEAVRAREIDVPIIVVSKSKSEQDILHALDAGADDYITVPVNPLILISKAKILMRRYRRSSRVPSSQVTIAGPFSYNNSNLKLYKNGVEIPMSSKENAIMKMFIDNVNKTFSKEIIHKTIWGNSSVDDNKIMVYINRIRSKIEEDPSRPKYLVTIRNIGYKFKI